MCIYIYVYIYIYIYIYIYVEYLLNLFVNIFLIGMVNTSQKWDEENME